MAIQFNLLPDVKQEYVKAQRTKHTITVVAFLFSALLILILFLMMTTVYVVNKKQLKDADKKVKSLTSEIQNKQDVDKILTIQNQLKALPQLHSQKHISSRIFTYLPEVTPAQVNLGKITIDFSDNTLEISGTTDTQKTINTFIDTLKFTTYKQGDNDTGNKAFPSVIEKNFGFEKEGVSYVIDATFDPILFSGNEQSIALNVPSGLATTRSLLNDPSSILFDGKTGTPKSTNTPSSSGTSTGTSTTPSTPSANQGSH
jgi:Tfp pilus assembly protein PilN